MIFFKFIKIIFTILLLFIIPLTLYVSSAFLLSFFLTKQNSSINKDETIYIVYDNVHSDIVFNLKNISDEWIKELPIVKNKNQGFIAFGWGDKETYLNTPTWDDIKLSTSLKALFINTPSVMHITYYPNINYFTGVRPIQISSIQSKIVKKSIFKSFNFKEKFYKGYSYYDLFYTSPYKYNLLHTCNTWTGHILKDANIIINDWTPFSKNVINSLP